MSSFLNVAFHDSLDFRAFRSTGSPLTVETVAPGVPVEGNRTPGPPGVVQSPACAVLTRRKPGACKRLGGPEVVSNVEKEVQVVLRRISDPGQYRHKPGCLSAVSRSQLNEVADGRVDR